MGVFMQELNLSQVKEFSFLPKYQSQVAVDGLYQIYEFLDGDNKTTLKSLPIFADITKGVDHITIELRNQIDSSIKKLHYPMSGAPCWNDELKASMFARAEGNNYVVDIIYPHNKQSKSSMMTYRITWEKDNQGRIHEFYEEFDANGKKLATGKGHLRILVPVKSH